MWKSWESLLAAIENAPSILTKYQSRHGCTLCKMWLPKTLSSLLSILQPIARPRACVYWTKISLFSTWERNSTGKAWAWEYRKKVMLDSRIDKNVPRRYIHVVLCCSFPWNTITWDPLAFISINILFRAEIIDKIIKWAIYSWIID